MPWHLRIEGDTDPAQEEALVESIKQAIAEVYDSHGVTNAQFMGESGYRPLNTEVAEDLGAAEFGAAAHIERETGQPEADREPAHPTAEEMDEIDRLVAERRGQSRSAGSVPLAGGSRSGSQ